MFLSQIKKGDTSISAYLPTLVLIIIAFLLAQVLSGLVLTTLAMSKGELSEELLRSLDFEAMGISSNLGFLILIASFLPSFFGLFFAKVFHKRPFLSFVTSRTKLDFKRIGFAVLVWGGILLATTLADYYINPENYVVSFNPESYFWLVLIAIVFFPFQIAFEEVFFRGYLYQLFGNLFKYPIISWIITSILFGLMHASNPEVKMYGFFVMMPGYILLGMFLGLITVLDDGLELALGVHLINNLFLGIGVNYAGSAIKVSSAFQVLTIDPSSNWYGIIISGSIFTFLAWKKYKFSGFNKLISPYPKNI